MLLIDKTNKMHIIELNVVLESNAESNAKQIDTINYFIMKHYVDHIRAFSLITLVITTGGVFSKDARSLFTMLNALKIDTQHLGPIHSS